MYAHLFTALLLSAPQDAAPGLWLPDGKDLTSALGHEDYHLHLEFKVEGDGVNAGVLLDGRWAVALDSDDDHPGAITGFAPPLVEIDAVRDRWQSLDVSYWKDEDQRERVTVWLGDRLVQDRLLLDERPESMRNAERGPSAEEGRARYMASAEESAACDWGNDFTVLATFRTTDRGTIVSKCPPEGIWVSDAKALFIRDGLLVYDIGWVGAVVGDVKVDNGEWHTAIVTNEGGDVNMWIDGDHVGDSDDLDAPDSEAFRVKIGAANTNFALRYDGDIARVLFHDFAASEADLARLFDEEPLETEPVFHWEAPKGGQPAENESGRIRLVSGEGRMLFREVTLEPLGTTDHAGLIATLDDGSLARGREIYEGLCAACHGRDGRKTINPNARPFALGTLENGSDPYSMWRTLTDGYKDMPVQDWLRPDQRYDVVHYLREEFLKNKNPGQHFDVDEAWLNTLPRGITRRPPVTKGATRDYGPALASQLGGDVGAALTVRLDPDTTISYDLQMAESSGTWTGGFLDLENTQHHKQRGEGRATPAGEMIPGLGGWAWGHGERLDFDRSRRWPRGPLPEEWLKHHGHYLSGDDIVLSYEIDGRNVLEHPSVDRSAGFPVITHRLVVEPGETPLVLALAERPDESPLVIMEFEPEEAPPLWEDPSGTLDWSIAVTGWDDTRDEPSPFAACATIGGGTLETDEAGRILLRIPPSDERMEYWLLRVGGRKKGILEGLQLLVTNLIERQLPPSPAEMVNGGPLRWAETLTTKGVRGDQTPYALDTIEIPFENPWNAWMRTSAIDFFDDGRAAVSTLGGDVWIVSGLDAELEEVTWKRFAAGMFEPLGLAIVDGKVMVTCRDRITRLHDLNADGEADFYETFYADTDVSTTFHAFNFDLQEDPHGDLFFVKAGQYTDSDIGGAVMRVTPEGAAFVYCTGFRTPNGMGMSADGRPLVGDNQGNWIPASKVSLTERRGFYGVFPAVNNGGPGNQTRPDFDQPAIWMPQSLDSSCGGQLWVEDERFGPLSGRYLHTSFGKGWMYGLTIDDDGVPQGAVWRLPFQFDAGIQRLRLAPHDGAVYTVGLSGWQGPGGGKDGCLERVRWTGADKIILKGARVVHDGVELEFSGPLDPSLAANPAHFTAKRWNYEWASNYGSAHYSLIEPGMKGEDPVKVTAAHVEGSIVHLQLEDVRVVNQLVVTYDLGQELKGEVFFTVNRVPSQTLPR
jgi:hypothetical protein